MRFAHVISRPTSITPFIPDEQYRDLLRRAAVIVVLSTDPVALHCAASEAIAVKRPLVVSESAVARARLRDAAVDVANEPLAIARGIEDASALGSALVSASADLSVVLEGELSEKLSALRADLA